MSSCPASSLHSILGGSSAGNARNWYCGVPKPRMSSARPGSPSRATPAEQESEGAVGPAVLGHADRVHALIEEVELAHGLLEVLDLLGERVELLLQFLDPVSHRGWVLREATATDGTSSEAVQINARVRTRRMSVDRLSWFVLAGPARAVAADQCQEHVVRVVPIAAVDCERGPEPVRGRAARAEEVAELAVRVPVLGHGHPGDARFPLVEALGGRQQAARRALQVPDPALEVRSVRPSVCLRGRPLATAVVRAEAGSAVPPGSGASL